jgi:hypothetical protein
MSTRTHGYVPRLALVSFLGSACIGTQCAAPPDGAPAPRSESSSAPLAHEDRFRGLTLDDWLAQCGLGVRLQSDPTGRSKPALVVEPRIGEVLVALEQFAPRSPRAIEALELVARDLDEDVRDDAAELLANIAVSRNPTHEAAAAALKRRLADSELAVARTFVDELADRYGDDDDAELLVRVGGAPLRADVTRACARLLREATCEDDVATALEGAVAVLPFEPGADRELSAILRARPLPWSEPWAADGLQGFAWSQIDVDDDAPPNGLQLALDAAHAAAELDADDPYAWNTLAFANWRIGTREEARTSSRRALEASVKADRDRDAFARNVELLDDDANWTDEARRSSRPRKQP